MSALLTAVALALVSAVCYAAAAIVQEQVAARAARRAVRKALWRSTSWWGSVALNGTGAVLHVLALGFGPLSVVQPLGVLTIVFVLPLAALCGARRARAAGWRGALLVSAGLAGLLTLTASRPGRVLTGDDQLALAVSTLAAIVLLVSAAWRIRRPALRSASLATAAGVAFGVASVFTKTVAADWSPQALAAQLPGIAVTAVLAGVGLLASQASYRGAGLAAPLATVTVVNPVVAAAAGIVLLGEGFRYGAAGVLPALAAAAVTGYGLVVLTADRVAGRSRAAGRTSAIRASGPGAQRGGRPGAPPKGPPGGQPGSGPRAGPEPRPGKPAGPGPGTEPAERPVPVADRNPQPPALV